MAGMKRSLSDQDGHNQGSEQKRRKTVQRKLEHKQPGLPEELPMEDTAFFGSQLIRTISITLKAVGFDGVQPDALEAFRAEAEEYMLRFCALTKQSMSSARRTQPLPTDFVHALSRNGLQSSDLLPQTLHRIPPSVVLPPLPPPKPAEEQPPDLEPILGEELSGAREKLKRKYIPKHFPNLPNLSTWQTTAVYATRETDPQKLREKANEEGIQAEKALRELMAAAKSSKSKARRNAQSVRREKIWEDTLAAMTQEDERRRKERDKAKEQAAKKVEEEQMNFDFDFGGEESSASKKAEPKKNARPLMVMEKLTSVTPMTVNYDSRYWRKSAQKLV